MNAAILGFNTIMGQMIKIIKHKKKPRSWEIGDNF